MALINGKKKTIKELALELRKLIANSDLSAIRQFCKKYPVICNEVHRRFVIQYNGNAPSEIKRLLEALKNQKEGALANGRQEMLAIMKKYIPSDQNLRQFDWYRKQLGGAWLLWQLGDPWNALLPDRLIWSRAWICPLSSRITPEMYPVPDLAFSPWKSHKLIKCDQVVQYPGLPPAIIDGAQFAKLSDKEKVALVKAPIDMRKK